MPEHEITAAQDTVSITGAGELDTALQQLIDVDGRAMAVAKRVEQVVNDPNTPPSLRHKLIAGMDQVIASSDSLHRFIQETLSPALTKKIAESPTAAATQKRRKSRTPRVRL
jgi:hypothetical protein